MAAQHERTFPVRTKKKTRLSAMVIIPPPDLWEPIQRLRREHDPQVKRWMPHITLLYPFVPESAFGEAAESAAAVCKRHRPFRLTLARFRYFVHGARSATLWLDPRPLAPLTDLQAALQKTFPHCDDVARLSGLFTPHLSVGRFAGEKKVAVACDRLQAEWAPLDFEVDRVCLIARSGKADDPFRVRREILLGRGKRAAPGSAQ